INWAGLTSPPGGRRRVKVNSKSLTASKQKSAANQTSDMRYTLCHRATEPQRRGDKEARGQRDKKKGRIFSLSTPLLIPSSLRLCVSVALWLLLAFSAPTTGAQPAAIRFTDVTAQSGINFKHVASPDKKYLVESMSAGVAAFDYDNDGY